MSDRAWRSWDEVVAVCARPTVHTRNADDLAGLDGLVDVVAVWVTG